MLIEGANLNNGYFTVTALDRVRGNIDTGAIVTLTAASSSGNSADQVNYNGRGLQLGVNITAISGTGTTPPVAIGIELYQNGGTWYWTKRERQ